jgi:hypothetical protein
MKKIILILTLVAFACSPLLTTEVHAATGLHTQTISSKHHKKHHKKGKKHKKSIKAA